MGKIDIQKILLEMARRNPHINQSVTTDELLKKYKDDPDIYISYTAIDKIGINPKSKYNTPLGIYCYPLKEIYKYVEDDTVPFASHLSYVWVIKRKEIPNMKFIEDASVYNDEDLDKDLAKLKDKYSKDLAHAYILKYDYEDEDVNHKGFQDMAFEDLVYDGIDTTDYRNLHKGNGAFANLWNITRLLSKELAKIDKYEGYKSSFIWNYILRSIGYTGMANKKGEGVIHHNEPTQAVFLSIKYFDTLEKIHNKRTKQYHDTKRITNKLMNKIFNNEMSYEDLTTNYEYDRKGLKIILDRAFREGKEDEIPDKLFSDFTFDSDTSQKDVDELLKRYIKYHKEAPTVILRTASRYMYGMYGMKVLNKVLNLESNTISKEEIGKLVDEALKRDLNIFESKLDIPKEYIPKIMNYYLDKYDRLPKAVLDKIYGENLSLVISYFYNKYERLPSIIINRLKKSYFNANDILKEIDKNKIKPFIKLLIENNVPLFNSVHSIDEEYLKDVLDGYFEIYGKVPNIDYDAGTNRDKKNIVNYYKEKNINLSQHMLYSIVRRHGIFNLLNKEDRYNILKEVYEKNIMYLNDMVMSGTLFDTLEKILDEKLKNGEDIRKDQLNTLSELSASRLFHHMIGIMEMLTKNTAEYMMNKPKLENEMRSMYGNKYEEILKKLGIDVSHQNKQ